MIKSILLVLPLLLITHLIYLYTHREFKPTDFSHPMSNSFAPSSPPPELHSILNQKFAYLGFGKQMTVYESADHNYVIKFFNPRPPIKKSRFHSLHKIKHFCTLKWFSESYFKKKSRLHKLFHRHVLAFNELRDETALVYVHLNASTAPDTKLQIVDKSGKLYLLDPKTTPFVLQKKAILAGTFLRQLDNQEETRHAYTALHALFAKRADKHFTDRIQTLNNNYGFIDGKAIQLDFGRIRKDTSLDKDQDLARILNNLKKSWPIFNGQPSVPHQQPI